MYILIINVKGCVSVWNSMICFSLPTSYNPVCITVFCSLSKSTNFLKFYDRSISKQIMTDHEGER